MFDPKVTAAINIALVALERMRILTVLLQEGRDQLEGGQSAELDFWMFELVGDAQTKIEAIRAASTASQEVDHE